MPESPYWKKVKDITEKISELFGKECYAIGKKTAIVGDVAWKKDFEVVSADLSSFDCGVLSVGFIFSDHITPDDLDWLEVIEHEGAAWQVNGKGIKRIIILKKGDLKPIRLEFFWDSGNPNTDFYGMVTSVRVVFPETNKMTIRYPWLLERATLPIINKMISDLFVLYGHEPISIIEKIDFDKKVEEVLRKSKIFELL